MSDASDVCVDSAVVRLQSRTRLHLVTAAPHRPAEACGFTSHDLIALACWMQRTDGHGYRRMLIERGSGDSGPEEAGYVLVYAPGSEWASWGLARSGAEIVVWRCSDGADLGCFATMLLALDRLPPVLARRIGKWPKPAGPLRRYSRVLPA